MNRIFLVLGIAGTLLPRSSPASTTNYFARGIVKEVRPAEEQLVIAHEAIPQLMDAMTMPFNVKEAAMLTNVTAGEQIAFQLHLTENESWIDHIERLAPSPSAVRGSPAPSKTDSSVAVRAQGSLRNYPFTNELGQPVRLSDFRGQAIALTFFFTRCPIPEYCPRLSRNFEEVQQRLSAMPSAPTNWHLISVTFDPANDTPERLKAYGAVYQSDPAHWSFLTGPADKIAELARSCDVQFDPTNGSFNHNFRTLIIDASNHLQMVFPVSGDLSESIVQELLKASGASNPIMSAANSDVRPESD